MIKVFKVCLLDKQVRGAYVKLESIPNRGLRGLLSWLSHWVGGPGDRDVNPVTAITFSCAAIHFSTVYNLHCHQRPVPLIPCLHGVGG